MSNYEAPMEINVIIQLFPVCLHVYVCICTKTVGGWARVHRHQIVHAEVATVLDFDGVLYDVTVVLIPHGRGPVMDITISSWYRA